MEHVERLATNPNCRIYHVRTLGLTNGSWDAAFPHKDEPLPTPIAEIPGVTTILFRPYAYWVSKSPAYDWSEIEPQVLAILGIPYPPTVAPDVEEPDGLTNPQLTGRQ